MAAQSSDAITSRFQASSIPLYMRNRRTRADEFTETSSLYWVIQGTFTCRQRILGFEDGVDENGRAFTTMMLDPELVRVEHRPRRNFGGWRYLDDTEVPNDLDDDSGADGEMPASLRQELRTLGLL
ncbi:DUF1489 family protein [Sulfitobacter sp. R18_1]|nr:DUF1489 family protein [Sulfitobacter sp. R18_1]